MCVHVIVWYDTLMLQPAVAVAHIGAVSVVHIVGNMKSYVTMTVILCGRM